MKAVVEQIESPERKEAFKKNAQTYIKKVIGDFKNYEFVSIQYSILPDKMSANDATAVHRREHGSHWHGCSRELQGAFVYVGI